MIGLSPSSKEISYLEVQRLEVGLLARLLAQHLLPGYALGNKCSAYRDIGTPKSI